MKVYKILIVLSFFLIPNSSQASIISYWSFSGNANNQVGTSNNGIVYGASLANDRFGNADSAYSFNGASYVDMGSLAIGKPFTVSLWFKSDAINSGWSTLFGWNDSSSAYGVQIATDGRGHVKERAGSTGYDLTSTETPDGDASWHMVTVTKDVSNTVGFYLDGSLIDSNTSGWSTMTNNLFIGKSFQPGSFKEFFVGSIDDVAIYDEALSSDVIRQNYSATSSVPEPSSLLLLFTGITGLLGLQLKKRRK